MRLAASVCGGAPSRSSLQHSIAGAAFANCRISSRFSRSIPRDEDRCERPTSSLAICQPVGRTGDEHPIPLRGKDAVKRDRSDRGSLAAQQDDVAGPSRQAGPLLVFQAGLSQRIILPCDQDRVALGVKMKGDSANHSGRRRKVVNHRQPLPCTGSRRSRSPRATASVDRVSETRYASGSEATLASLPGPADRNGPPQFGFEHPTPASFAKGPLALNLGAGFTNLLRSRFPDWMGIASSRPPIDRIGFMKLPYDHNQLQILGGMLPRIVRCFAECLDGQHADPRSNTVSER